MKEPKKKASFLANDAFKKCFYDCRIRFLSRAANYLPAILFNIIILLVAVAINRLEESKDSPHKLMILLPLDFK